MRLKSLRLFPFAGLKNLELKFAPGLNVVLGPNDIGKTTVFRAIDSVLFLAQKVSRSTREGKELLPRILPLNGDQARAALEWESGGETYRLEKIWGQGAGVQLEGKGQRYVQEEKVDETLRTLLPVPPATFQNVLFMGQGALEGTVAALAEKRDSLHSLGDFLRLAVDKTSGISVERLKARLAARLEESFSHWDNATQGPEQGRGIERKWQKDVGSVLAAYYLREERKAEARSVQQLESARDAKLTEWRLKQAGRDEARAFVAANKPLVASASARQALSAQQKERAAAHVILTTDYAAWNEAKVKRELFAPEVERLEAARARLEEELRSVLAGAKRREVLGRFEKAKVARQAALAARAALDALPVLKAEDLKRLRTGVAELEALKAGLSAGKLQLQFSVKRELDISFRKDLDHERRGTMTPGKPMTLNAGGRIQLSSELFELQVTSGDGRLSEIEAQLAARADQLGKLQLELKVQTLEEAQEKHESWQAAANNLRSAEAVLGAALAPGEKFEELERAAAALGTAGSGREPELVQAEKKLLETDLEGKKEGLVKATSLLNAIVGRHSVSEPAALAAKMIEVQGELGELGRKLALLPSLPEGLGGLDEFLVRFEREERNERAFGDDAQKLAVELEALKAQLGERSAQDCEVAAAEAAAAFDRELKAGRALLRVAAAVTALDAEGGDLYAGFRSEFEKSISLLSRDKYAKTAMQEALPVDFLRSDGAKIPFAWLSAGTKDAFALALRLAMAGHFLGSSTGFLLLDDPLVNMDPERQKIAAGLLQGFAKERQLVVFTCHPAHAELLGGTVHRLGQ